MSLASTDVASFAKSFGARSVGSGRRVVVVGEDDDEGAAAVAERLSAHGVDAAWLVGGVGAWEAAGHPRLHGRLEGQLQGRGEAT